MKRRFIFVFTLTAGILTVIASFTSCTADLRAATVSAAKVR
jgi:hypothetical protein